MGEKNRDIAQRDSFWRFEGGDGEERQELNGLDIHGPGEADGEVLLLIYKCRISVPNSQLGLNPLIV